MSQAAVPDQLEIISDKLVAWADDEDHNVDTGHHVDDRYRPTQQRSYPQPALEWMGPVAFAKAYESVRGIDYDFGTRWGPNGDQLVSLRLEVGANTGLLYVYDPTWDEYAVLGTFVQLVAVEHAVARARQFDDHPTVEKFQELAPNVGVGRVPLGPEL